MKTTYKKRNSISCAPYIYYFMLFINYEDYTYANLLASISRQSNDLIIFIVVRHIIDESFHRNQLRAYLIMEQIGRTDQGTMIFHLQWFHVDAVFTTTTQPQVWQDGPPKSFAHEVTTRHHRVQFHGWSHITYIMLFLPVLYHRRNGSIRQISPALVR